MNKFIIFPINFTFESKPFPVMSSLFIDQFVITLYDYFCLPILAHISFCFSSSFMIIKISFILFVFLLLLIYELLLLIICTVCSAFNQLSQSLTCTRDRLKKFLNQQMRQKTIKIERSESRKNKMKPQRISVN